MAVEKCSAKQQAFVNLVGEVLGVRLVGCSEISAPKKGGLVANFVDGSGSYMTKIDKKGNIEQITKCAEEKVTDAYELGGHTWIKTDSTCSNRVIRSSINSDKLAQARKIILAYKK